ncbi:MAG TPA: hypothetical protein VF942_03660, partial [Acidimicrobiales bacterium]
LLRFPLWGKGWEATVGEGMGSSTSMEALSADERDYVVWRLSWSRVSPINHPAEPVHRDSGAAEVDLFRGTLVPVSQGFPDRSLTTQPSDPQGGYHTEPFEVAGITAVAATEYVRRQFRIVLRRKRGAARLPDVVLCRPPWNGFTPEVEVSADRRHVLGNCQNPPRPRPDRYDVVVYSTVTGEKVARLAGEAWPVSILSPTGWA